MQYHGNAATATQPSYCPSPNAGILNVKSPELPALESIANRIQNLAVRLDDTNRNTLAFVERVSGAEATKPEGVSNARDGGSIMPALATIESLLGMLDYHVTQADNLARKLGRIT